ncbi:hypothetical protein AB0L82_32610 [Nocardia sp. NPDC052001]|uniref:hypothetical protein n=1 Tax=Nocardia sp. NPDC052001 TaxID=3154853 RepID=UPI003415B216
MATISDMARVAVVLDLESGALESIPVRPEFIDPNPDGAFSCRPFGITWAGEELYIANHRQLLVFDKQLNYVRTLPVSLQVNIHQLAYHEGWVWAVSPRTNSLIGVHLSADTPVVEFDLLDQQVYRYAPRHASEAQDRHHFNSLLWADEHLFVAAHNFNRPSFVNAYRRSTRTLDYVLSDAGSSIHGLACLDGELFWIGTLENELRSDRGYRLRLPRPGYARGLVMTLDHFIVATSEFLHRNERRHGDSWIQMIDRHSGTVVREFHLRGTGGINDLRLLDAFDYAHWLDPFWSDADRRAVID